MIAVVIVGLIGILCMLAPTLRLRRALPVIIPLGLVLAMFGLQFNFILGQIFFFTPYSQVFSGALLVLALVLFLLRPATTIEHSRDAMLLFSLSGALLLSGTTHFLGLFMGLELLSIPLYALAGSSRNAESKEAGLKYFLLGAFASTVLLFGLALIYAFTGVLQLSEIHTFLASGGSPVVVGLLLVLFGLLFKVGLAPVHYWVPDVYEGTPTVYTAFMSTIPKAAGLYVLMIFFFSLGDWVGFSLVLPLVLGISMLLGNLLALRQRSLKRLLAYSSIAHAGYMALSILGNGFGDLLQYVVAYGVASLIILSVLARLESQGIQDVKGLRQNNPFLSGMLTIALLSLAGIPPLAGFFAKYHVLSGISANVPLLMVALVSAFIGFYYYFRVIFEMYATGETAIPRISVSVASRFFYVLAAVMLLGLGVLGLGG